MDTDDETIITGSYDVRGDIDLDGDLDATDEARFTFDENRSLGRGDYSFGMNDGLGGNRYAFTGREVSFASDQRIAVRASGRPGPAVPAR